MAETKLIKTAAEEALAATWQGAKGRLPGSAEVGARRAAAFARFEAAGLPNRRVEQWKYTDLRVLMRDAKPLTPPPDAAAKARAKSLMPFASSTARRLTFVDGAFVAELSDLDGVEKGVTIGTLAEALSRSDGAAGEPNAADSDPAFALNAAFMGDGAIIAVAAGVTVERPLHLVFVYASDQAAAVYSRSQVVIGAGSRVTLLESHVGSDGIDYQINTALTLSIGDGAEVEHVKVGLDGNAALHLATVVATLGKGVKYRDFIFTTGGAVVRNQLFVSCNGPDSEIGLRGASMLAGRQHADTTLVLDHAIGHCQSRELYKSVLEDESRGIFQGKIIVRPDAQKTDARMMSQALLLSENAEADHKPELEIFADDVQCGHGATAGALDENLKFYLMARGIPDKDAEALLIESFVAEGIEAIADAGVRDALTDLARAWLTARD
jgi:Fe-S cluster assembly protein SufD